MKLIVLFPVMLNIIKRMRIKLRIRMIKGLRIMGGLLEKTVVEVFKVLFLYLSVKREPVLK
jgi:hypothetical protein